MITEADESSTGPASFMIADPDGNVIMLINTYENVAGGVSHSALLKVLNVLTILPALSFDPHRR